MRKAFTFRGHGTYLKGDKLYSSVSGVLDRVNKLVSVKALRCRYSGDIGDVVIGRILEVLCLIIRFLFYIYLRLEGNVGRSM